MLRNSADTFSIHHLRRAMAKLWFGDKVDYIIKMSTFLEDLLGQHLAPRHRFRCKVEHLRCSETLRTCLYLLFWPRYDLDKDLLQKWTARSKTTYFEITMTNNYGNIGDDFYALLSIYDAQRNVKHCCIYPTYHSMTCWRFSEVSWQQHEIARSSEVIDAQQWRYQRCFRSAQNDFRCP